MSNDGFSSAQRIYEKANRIVGRIAHIYTDGNSCYEDVFKKISESHMMAKRKTHLIESSNSSIRDNLAKFNRRSKRYSKSLEMLEITMDLFINRMIFDFDFNVALI